MKTIRDFLIISKQFSGDGTRLLIAMLLMIILMQQDVRAQMYVKNSSNQPLMTIQQGGNMGIGTTAPGAKLDVSGQVKISGGSPGAGKVLTSDASGLATWQTPSTGVGGTGVATRVAFWSGTSTLSNNANLYWDNTNSRLGIGQTNPGGSLGIASHSGNEIHFSGTGSANIYSQGMLDLAAGSGSSIQMRSNGSSTANMILNSSGYLGIGVTNPVARLDVNGQVKISGGSPGAGRVLTSDASGLASWDYPKLINYLAEAPLFDPPLSSCNSTPVTITQLTVTVSGYYFVSFAAGLEIDANAAASAFVDVNDASGTVLNNGFAVVSSTALMSGGQGKILYLNAGDIVKLKFHRWGGAGGCARCYGQGYNRVELFKIY